MQDRFRIKTSFGLNGNVNISGAKNATLPIMCASILTNERIELSNAPNLKDVTTMIGLLNNLGCQIEFNPDKSNMVIHASNLESSLVPYDLVKTMRASILALGPLVSRFGNAKVSLPGGCAIGARPVDQHIKGLIALGANIHIEHGYIYANAPNGLTGTTIVMDLVTVTCTENLMMAASIAKGVTVLKNCACEPEVVDLANCLNAMGAKIVGAGTSQIIIYGVDKLHHCCHTIIGDRIEAGTFAVAAVVTRGKIKIDNIDPSLLSMPIEIIRATGAICDVNVDSITVDAQNIHKHNPVDIHTAPYPAFPTDLQAQFMLMNVLADGSSTIVESIFENRFMHVPELCRMGADININGNVALIRGVQHLSGANVMATDLRCSASMVLAGLVADGETVVDRIYHLDRGYQNMELKLNALGANIERIKLL